MFMLHEQARCINKHMPVDAEHGHACCGCSPHPGLAEMQTYLPIHTSTACGMLATGQRQLLPQKQPFVLLRSH